MEQLGNDPATIYVGTHSAVGGPNVGTTMPIKVSDTSRGFHVYGLDWEKKTKSSGISMASRYAAYRRLQTCTNPCIYLSILPSVA